MKKIPLYTGRFTRVSAYALVDDEDYETLSAYKWRLDHYGYAANVRRINGKTKTVFMHGYLLPHPKGTEIDHINRNPCDNRKSNLRIATRSQNNMNSKRRVNNTSGIRGVSLHKQTGKWRAYISYNGKQINLGLFWNIKDAAQVRKQKATELYGGFVNE